MHLEIPSIKIENKNYFLLVQLKLKSLLLDEHILVEQSEINALSNH